MKYKEYTHKELMENPKALEERIEELWGYLHEMGIYTEEQLNKFVRDNPLDIGIFTMPYKNKEGMSEAI